MIERILIVAIGKHGEMGLDGGLPWNRIPADMKRFKELTVYETVIMGRKTFESILRELGNPLPNRVNIVLSKQKEFTLPSSNDSVLIASSVEEALDTVETRQVFFIGGVSIYKEALTKGLVDRAYVTRVWDTFPADTFFPRVNWSNWAIVENRNLQKDEGNPFDISFETYEPLRKAFDGTPTT